ncbi:MAG: NAD(P)/FAD-dependent oxidoreductase [Solirubrobacteraceae bacterium]
MHDLLAPLLGLAAALLLVLGAVLLVRRPATPREPLPPGQRVVVVGGGFGGLQAVNQLRKLPVEVTLIDRRNFHLFQPLVYQVATGALSAGEIASPLRAIFKRARNVRVLLGEVGEVDLERRVVSVQPPIEDVAAMEVPYDMLIVAGGSKYSYFGHPEWADYAPEIKSLERALDVRYRILRAFEAAELETDHERRAEWLTFVVVGAGPTGVEMAGQISELARDTLPSDYRAMNTGDGRILLVEAGDRVLAAFPPDLSDSAVRQLDNLGVTSLVNEMVVHIDDAGVQLKAPDGTTRRVGARTVIWAAGVAAASVAGRLAEAAGAETDRAGRLTVEPDLTLPGHPEVMALGDMVRVRAQDGGVQELPGVAPVAMQQGRYAAAVVKRRLAGKPAEPFRYIDKGNLATIGRARAVAEIKGLHFGGPVAWLLWLGIHIFYLIGFQNRILVLTRWSFSFLTRGRGARLITGEAATRSRVGVSTPQE